jgi:hypothetical protein
MFTFFSTHVLSLGAADKVTNTQTHTHALTPSQTHTHTHTHTHARARSHTQLSRKQYFKNLSSISTYESASATMQSCSQPLRVPANADEEALERLCDASANYSVKGTYLLFLFLNRFSQNLRYYSSRF